MWILAGPSSSLLIKYPCKFKTISWEFILLEDFEMEYNQEIIDDLKKLEEKFPWSKPRYSNERLADQDKLIFGFYTPNYKNVNCCGYKPYYKITDHPTPSRGYMKNGLYYSTYNEFIDHKLILTKQEIQDYNEKHNYVGHACDSDDDYDYNEEDYGSLFGDDNDY